MEKSLIEKHIESCGKKTRRCEFCGVNIARKSFCLHQAIEHMINPCPQVNPRVSLSEIDYANINLRYAPYGNS